MNVEDILFIIDAIPSYIKYIYPGYLSMYIYWFLRGKTLKDNNYVIIKSIAISYVYISIIHGFSNIEFTSCFTNSNSLLFRYEILINVILILASVIFPYILYRAITPDIITQV